MKNIKKAVFITAILAILLAPSLSSATTIAEIQAQLNAILQKVQQLQEQLNQYGSGIIYPTPSPTPTPTPLGQPSCNISFTPSSIGPGQLTTVRWSSQNDADNLLDYNCTKTNTGSIIGSGQGAIGASGSLTYLYNDISQYLPATCTLTAKNSQNQTSICSANISKTSSTINYTELIMENPLFSNNQGTSAKFYKFTIPPGGCAASAQVWLAGWVPNIYNNNMLLSDTDFGTVANAMAVYNYLFGKYGYIGGGGGYAQKIDEYPAESGILYWSRFTGSGEAEFNEIGHDRYNEYPGPNPPIPPIPGHTYYLMIIGATDYYSQWRLTVYCY